MRQAKSLDSEEQWDKKGLMPRNRKNLPLGQEFHAQVGRIWAHCTKPKARTPAPKRLGISCGSAPMAEGQVIREIGLRADMAGHEDARIRMGEKSRRGRGSAPRGH